MHFRESDMNFGFLILRLTIGLTFLMAGINKLLNFSTTVDYLQGGFVETWLPGFIVAPFAYVLPFAEAVLGGMIVLGFMTRPALYLTGFLMLSLNFGLLVKSDHAGVARNIVYLVVIGLDIMLLNYNKYSLDNLFFGSFDKS
jgi:thiosulfate dehydrogenase (quinone) large subunit